MTTGSITNRNLAFSQDNFATLITHQRCSLESLLIFFETFLVVFNRFVLMHAEEVHSRDESRRDIFIRFTGLVFGVVGSSSIWSDLRFRPALGVAMIATEHSLMLLVVFVVCVCVIVLSSELLFPSL